MLTTGALVTKRPKNRVRRRSEGKILLPYLQRTSYPRVPCASIIGRRTRVRYHWLVKRNDIVSYEAIATTSPGATLLVHSDHLFIPSQQCPATYICSIRRRLPRIGATVHELWRDTATSASKRLHGHSRRVDIAPVTVYNTIPFSVESL